MKSILLVLPIGLMFIAACGSGIETQYIYQLPAKANDGFEVGTLDDVGIDPDTIGLAIDEIWSGRFGEVHSMLIYREGKLVLEEYFPGHDYAWESENFHGDWVDWGRDVEHNVHSVGKSITSACVGIAIDQGFIESVEEPIFKYLPAYQYLETGEKGTINIEHLLTMTSGLAWDEWGSSYSSAENDIIKLWVSCEDPVACILEKPMVREPGEEFNYSGGNMILLGEIIRNATGEDIEAFSWEYLFGPLGIDTPEWRWIENSDVVYAGGDQRLTPREMLKFGVLYLDDGVWVGTRIIPESWVERSAAPYPGPESTWFNSFIQPIPPGDATIGRRGFSYTWWTHEFWDASSRIPVYWAFGWGGQKIAIFPEQDAVVVLTGGNYSSTDSTTRILKTYVVPSLQ